MTEKPPGQQKADPNLLQKGKDLFNRWKESLHGGGDEKIGGDHELDVFDMEYKDACPIVPWRTFLALASEPEFSAALWLLERRIKLAEYEVPLKAINVLTDSAKTNDYLEVIASAALIFKIYPDSLLFHPQTWPPIANAMEERAMRFAEYMIQPWERPQNLAREFIKISGKPTLVPDGEQHMKIDLLLYSVPPEHIHQTFPLLVSWICGSIIETDFLAIIIPSPEFQACKQPDFPKRTEGQWLESFQAQRTWWRHFSASFSSFYTQTVSSSSAACLYLPPSFDQESDKITSSEEKTQESTTSVSEPPILPEGDWSLPFSLASLANALGNMDYRKVRTILRLTGLHKTNRQLWSARLDTLPTNYRTAIENLSRTQNPK